MFRIFFSGGIFAAANDRKFIWTYVSSRKPIQTVWMSQSNGSQAIGATAHIVTELIPIPFFRIALCQESWWQAALRESTKWAPINRFSDSKMTTNQLLIIWSLNDCINFNRYEWDMHMHNAHRSGSILVRAEKSQFSYIWRKKSDENK